MPSMVSAACQRSTFRSAQKVAAPTGSFIRSGSFSKRLFSGMTCCPPCLAHQVVFPLALIPSTTKIIVMTTPLIAPSSRVPKHRRLTTTHESHPQPSFQHSSPRESARPELFALIFTPRATLGCALKSSDCHTARPIPERPHVSHACHHRVQSDFQSVSSRVRPAG